MYINTKQFIRYIVLVSVPAGDHMVNSKMGALPTALKILLAKQLC